MYKLFPFLFFICCFLIGNAQDLDHKWQLAIGVNAHLNKARYNSDYTYPVDSPERFNYLRNRLGNGIQLSLSRYWQKNLSFRAGLGFNQMHFTSRLIAPIAINVVSNPAFAPSLLRQHSFNLLSIHLGVQQDFFLRKRWSLFQQLNIVPLFQLSEIESYQSVLGTGRNNTIETDNSFKLFGLGFDWNFGTQCRLINDWALMINVGLRLGEFRSGNPLILNNGIYLYEKQWLGLSQINMGMGIIKSLN